jgi:hypothetical protein
MMRRNPRLFRLTSSVALATLLGNPLLPLAAAAQPPPTFNPQPDQNQSDPPARVGRVAGITGQVSYHTSGDTQWTAAGTNFPVSSGYAYWTEPNAITQLEVSASRVVLAGATEFDVTTLDTSGLQAVAAQGETYLHLRDLAPNEVWSVQTPRGLVRLTGAGRYNIVVGTTDQPTLVTVLDGTADIQGPNLSLQVSGSQTATITGSDSFVGSIGPAVRDAFLSAQLAAEQPPSRPSAPIPQYVSGMPGGGELAYSGSWSDAPEYGHVWYPPVSPGWVPYRQGHWAFVAPWGWTWIDDARWGFAPFHYGRWLQIDGRWAWTPGQEAVAQPPVYAPALVTFIGIGAGVALGAALASGSIGWVPLGPREAYHPWYHTSDAYFRQVNINHVTNITTVNNNVAVNNFVNRAGATSVPASALTGSRPVQALAQPVTAAQFAAARPVVGRQPVAPTGATAGVTPVVARQMNLSSGANRPAAPGPVVHAQATEPGSRPALPTHGGAAAPGEAVREPAHHGPVPLPTAGARPAGLPEAPATQATAPSGTARNADEHRTAGSAQPARPNAAVVNHAPPAAERPAPPRPEAAPRVAHAEAPVAGHAAPAHPAAAAAYASAPAHAAPAVAHAAPAAAHAAPAVAHSAPPPPHVEERHAAAPAPHAQPAEHRQKKPGER